MIQSQKCKRSTKAEMAAKREAQEAARVAAEEEKRVKFQRIVDLEEEIAKEDSVDITPRPALPKIRLQPQRCLRRTETYIEPTMSADEATASDAGGNDQRTDAEFAVRSNATVDTGTDVEETATRVAKKVKLSIRGTIDKARKDLAGGTRNKEVGADAINAKGAPAPTSSCGDVIKDKVHATLPLVAPSVLSHYSQMSLF